MLAPSFGGGGGKGWRAALITFWESLCLRKKKGVVETAAVLAEIVLM